MDCIPLDPEDDNVASLLDSFGKFPFSFVGINHPGDYEKESIIFRANEDIDSLYGFILFFYVEDMETGLPDYSQTRFLTFDEIEIEEGSHIEIFTRKGEDVTTIDQDTCAFRQIIYWGLSKPIWSIPHSSYELMKRSDSIGGGL